MYYSGWISEESVTFSNNNAYYNGLAGGITFDEYCDWTAIGPVTFTNNYSNYSGGAVLMSSYSTWRTNGPATLTGNSAGAIGGGAVYISEDTATWASTGPVTLSANSAPLGGGVYLAGTWTNSYYQPSFSANSAQNDTADIYCIFGNLVSLVSACNTTTISCSGCRYATITNTLSLSPSTIAFDAVGQSQTVTLTLAESLPTALTVPFSFSSSSGSSGPLYFNPAGAVVIPSGSTSVSVTIGINSTNSAVNLQGTFQLTPPTPELMVLLSGGNSNSIAVTVALSPSSAVGRLSAFWVRLLATFLSSLTF